MEQSSGLRTLLPYGRPYRGLLILGTFYAFIGAAASAFNPVVLGYAIDALLLKIDQWQLITYAGMIIILTVILAVFRYLLRMLTGTMAAGVSYTMAQDLYKHILTFDRATQAEFGTGDLLSRASSDFIYIWRFYSAGFQMAIHAIFFVAHWVWAHGTHECTTRSYHSVDACVEFDCTNPPRRLCRGCI